MKVHILTIHSILNYGSALQTYALNKYLRDQNIDSQVIDYRPNYKKNFIGSLQSIVVKILFFIPYRNTFRKFRDFIGKNIEKTRPYKYDELFRDPPASDIYIVGSDQVWNSAYPCGRDAAYYLRFVKRGKKVSYAASIGRKDVSEEDLLQLKDNIKDFNSISFREKSTVILMDSVGLSGTQHVCDPVFLLDQSQYSQFMKKPLGGKYLIVYTVEDIPLVSEAAKSIADQLKLEIIQIGGFRRKVKYGRFDRTVGPEEFLSYIKSAAFVLTSSFHCTAFSIILNINFAVILPPKNSERLTDILDTTGLHGRIIHGQTDVENVLTDIDFNTANAEVEKLRQSSRQFVLKATKPD